jgi:hypothetical protein
MFLYIHIYFHLKTSNDLEIYEIDKPSKDKFEEICDLKQPVLMNLENEQLLEIFTRNNILDTYGVFDVKIRNIKSIITNPKTNKDDELYLPLPFSSTIKVIENDTDNKFLVENNYDFLEETGLIKTYKYNDSFLRPYMVSNCMYDYIISSNDTCSPFRYELNYRNYFLVTEGEIKVKLSPPNSSRYLYTIKDFENMEFKSPVNPWDVQSQYKTDFSKIKCLEIIIKKGYVLFIPAFWWYSIKFSDNASICSFKYRTYMNNIAILDNFFMRFLQTQNVKRNILKITSNISIS